MRSRGTARLAREALWQDLLICRSNVIRLLHTFYERDGYDRERERERVRKEVGDRSFQRDYTKGPRAFFQASR